MMPDKTKFLLLKLFVLSFLLITIAYACTHWSEIQEGQEKFNTGARKHFKPEPPEDDWGIFDF